LGFIPRVVLKRNEKIIVNFEHLAGLDSNGKIFPLTKISIHGSIPVGELIQYSLV
jgi:hypothetical protein